MSANAIMRKAKIDEVAVLHSKSLTQLALPRLWHDRLTMIAVGVLVFLALSSIGAPVITGVLGVNPNTTDAAE